jgi:hypothetical protein
MGASGTVAGWLSLPHAAASRNGRHEDLFIPHVVLFVRVSPLEHRSV